MEIYLIRHTTPNIEKGICFGQSDLDLDENYASEFKTIQSKIPITGSIKVFSSPLKRCSLLAKQFSNEVHYDKRLKELELGNWEMKLRDATPEKELTPWMSNFVNTTVPGGESYIQLASRVKAFFEDILNSGAKENLIIIAHAGPMRAFLSSILDIDLKDSFNIKINYGDIFHLKQEANTIRLITEVPI